jgi:hypothetical protein
MSVLTADALPDGYQLQVTVNHAALVTAGNSLASGDDVRILYWDGGSWTELDRVLVPGSSWNNAATKLYFRTQTAIGSSTTNTDYYVYYGNAGAAAPPANGDNIFELYDDFSGGAVDTDKWDLYEPSGGSVAQTGGYLRVTGSDVAVWSGVGVIGHIGWDGDLLEPGMAAEVTVSMVAQSVPLQQYSQMAVGPDFSVLSLRSSHDGVFPGSGVGGWYCWDPDDSHAYVHRCASSQAVGDIGMGEGAVGYSTMDDQTFGNIRATTHVGVDGLVKYYEDGVLIATVQDDPQAMSQQVKLHYVPNDNPGGVDAFEVRYDDFILRKSVESPPSIALDISSDVELSVQVLPVLLFAVTGRATTCNGQSSANFQTASTGTVVNMGRVNIATVAGGAQDLSVTSNAGNGFVVYLRTPDVTPDALRNGGESISDVAGTRASPGAPPSAGTEGFGYTSSDVATAFTNDTWAKLTNTDDSVVIGPPGTTSKSACVGYETAVGAATPAGSYSANIIYTAVPSY